MGISPKRLINHFTIPDNQSRPTWVDSGRIPCLDGLRAVGISLVIFSHAIYHRYKATWLLPPWFGRDFDALEIGRLGVDLFFVISGFLITILLFREQDRRGRISLKDFYLRRTFRILPAYLGYLAFVAVIGAAGFIVVPRSGWFGPLTFSSNYFSPPQILEHTWSLSVEEQFYLCWPLTLVLLGRRLAVVPLVAMICLAPFARALMYARWGGGAYMYRVAPGVADVISIGCLLAYVVTSWPYLVAWVDRYAAAVLVASVYLTGFTYFGLGHFHFPAHSTPTVRAASLAVGVLATIGLSRSVLGRLLESRPVVWVGTLSYSLYLWQQPFVLSGTRLYPGILGGILVAIGAAAASHYAIERPFLRLKNRLGRQRHGSVRDPEAKLAAERIEALEAK